MERCGRDGGSDQLLMIATGKSYTCQFNPSHKTNIYARVYYNLVSVFNDQVIDIDNSQSVGSAHKIHSQNYVEGYEQHCWEFVIPAVSFPPGWFQIQNAGTGELLSHKYVCNPPILLPSPESPRPCQDRESWQFQWTLTHGKFYDSKFTGGRNAWRIVNRLTGAGLSCLFNNITPKTLQDHGPSFLWKLELDPSCNWKIANITTSCLLEKSTTASFGGTGTAVICENRKFIPKGGSMSWILR